MEFWNAYDHIYICKDLWNNFYKFDPKTRMQGGMKSVLKTWEKFDKIMQSGDLDAFCRNISTNTFRKFLSDAYITY